jgi:hypothetical protein
MDQNEQFAKVKEDIQKALEEQIKPLLEKNFDTNGYYYDANSGKVYFGTGRDVWNMVLVQAAAKSIFGGMGFMKPAKPMRIEAPLDEESIELLYGKIIKVEEVLRFEAKVHQQEP